MGSISIALIFFDHLFFILFVKWLISWKTEHKKPLSIEEKTSLLPL